MKSEKSIMRAFIFTLFFLLFHLSASSQKAPLRRADSFFGLHFDFHAGLTDSLVGRTLTEGMIDTLLSAVKPDFIQVDCKGHAGVTSYPTKVANGTHVPSFAKDPLELFRKVTRKHGVALYVHYSGVWDDAALRKQPQWGAMDAEGKVSTQKTSVHSSYVDELLIPQLKEVADYGVDGVWIDGDCWATVLDYSPKAIGQFQRQTGIMTVPKSKKDPHYQEFLDFTRESFRTYVRHYVDFLHRYKPEFQVASNWAYSSFMPEPVKIGVDFMSGDITPMNGVNSALFESRVLASQSRVYNKPWDLMSWSFNSSWSTWTHGSKTPLNLNQEAAEIMAMGGGYQCYFRQNRDASIRVQQVKTMAEIARFARARQPFTQGARAVPQIALLYSLPNFLKYSPNIFGNGGTDNIKGILTALMDGQQAVEILAEHHFQGNLSRYPLIVVPECIYLDESFLQQLRDYVRNGGTLLVIGAEAVKNFKDELQIEWPGPSRKEQFWVDVNGDMGVVLDSLQKVKPSMDARILGRYYMNEDTRFPDGVSASMRNYGKGKIAGVYFDFGRSYLNYQSPQLRDFLNNIVGKLFTDPIVQVTGSKLVHVTVNDLKGKLTVNLVNAGGSHSNTRVYTYDELPPLNDLTVKIRLDKKPKTITIQPENRALNFSFSNGIATVKLPRLEVHSILVVE